VVTPSDEQLLDVFVRDRSDHNFLVLYDRHAPAMYALACRLLGGRDGDAADALQDAWTRALTRLDQFRGDSSLRTWLCGFVVNCCRERLRRPLLESHDDSSVLPVPSVISDEHRVLGFDLERALQLLPDGYRAVVVLHDIEGYTHQEIARALHIDEGTSKSQLSRGRRALRRCLDPRAIKRGNT
jgi:RNA polymerase sigma-70 factor (ECF subfamily)